MLARLLAVMTDSRPVFNPVDTSFDPAAKSQKDDVESPSLSSSNALARFEFEPGRGKDGTKVLMVEWEDDETTKDIEDDWEVSWHGKKTVLPANKHAKGETAEVPVNRVYFMLGAGVDVPTSVKLRKGGVEWRTNPLPAIFAPELGASAREAGKKGVLHTIWAKQRLQVLQKEIDAESKKNTEGLSLEMAVAEKGWIEQNFGVVVKPISTPIQGAVASVVSNFGGPSSPRSPGGGRLMDRLKGLKLETCSSEANGTASLNTTAQHFHTTNPLSPETSDVAVGSFGSFAALKGMPLPSSLASKPAQSLHPPQRIAPVRPPDSLVAKQQQQTGLGSLNAFASHDTGFSSNTANDGDDDDQNDLFALPMSPRSPEMTRSPFTFAAQDTMKYVKG